MSKLVKYKHEEEAMQYLKDNYSSNDQESILKDKKRLNLIEVLLSVSYLIYLVIMVAVCVYFEVVAQRGISRWKFEYIDTFLQVAKCCIISAPIALTLVIVTSEVSARTIGKKWTHFYNDYLKGGLNEKKI